MKKLFVLFVCVFTVVQLYGQQHIRETYPTVRFQCMDNRGDSVVITQEELPVHFELYYDGKRAGLLSPSVYWDNPDLEFGYGSPKRTQGLKVLRRGRHGCVHELFLRK